MKKVIAFFLLIALAGCVHFSYEAKEELKDCVIKDSKLSTYDMTIGIEFVNETREEAMKNIKGDLPSELASWFVHQLNENRSFKKVVNLHEKQDEEVDVVLKGLIKSVKIEGEGISGLSSAMALWYGVAPMVEHYASKKRIKATAIVKFQLIGPKTGDILWYDTITETVRKKTQLAKSDKLIPLSISRTVSTLLNTPQFPEELARFSGIPAAPLQGQGKLPTEKIATSHEGRKILQRWAVVIGISKYNDDRIPTLRYASRDARGFYQWLTAPDKGGYDPSNVKLLLDEQATYRNMREVLFDWLQKAIEEDMVILYFAGHGSPSSPDTPDNLFLLPSDAHYDKIETTGFPMWDIQTALKRFIKAKKVVVVADACHSGGIGSEFTIARRGIRLNSQINEALQDLTNISDGVAVITASGEKQLSQEDVKWGGGHGVFTWYLLQGLDGRADHNNDKKVTLGELITYLSEQVRRETRNAQCPSVAGKFDPALTLHR